MDRAPCKYLMSRVQRPFMSTPSTSPPITRNEEGGEVMERRHFLKFAVGFTAGAAALAASAQAAPLAPAPIASERLPSLNENAIPARTAQKRSKPPQAGTSALGPSLAPPPLGLASPPLGLASPSLASAALAPLAPPVLVGGRRVSRLI